MEIYVIKDITANAYDTPFFQKSHVQATRAFRTEINRKDDKNMMYLYPGEYDLYYLGSFNQETGEIKPENQKIANGNQLKTT